MIEFAICFPFHVKKVKGSSTGMQKVMNHEDTFDPRRGRKDTGDPTQQLIDFVCVKIQERYRNMTAAFRAFDTAGKGKIRRSNLIEGFDKMRIRLSG